MRKNECEDEDEDDEELDPIGEDWLQYSKNKWELENKWVNKQWEITQ